MRKSLWLLERVKGIEPSSQAWEARILPLNHTRFLFRHRIRSRRAGKPELFSRLAGRRLLSKLLLQFAHAPD